MRNYMTIFLAGKSFLIKSKQTQKANHLQILEIKPVPVKGLMKVTITLVAGKISLNKRNQSL